MGNLRDFKFGVQVDRVQLVSAGIWQTVPERGVVMSVEILQLQNIPFEN